MITLTWTEQIDRQGKREWILRCPDIPVSPLVAKGSDRKGICYHTGARVWRAEYWPPDSYGSLFCLAGSAAKAMRVLERNLDKRSIGFWGTGDINFERISL